MDITQWVMIFTSLVYLLIPVNFSVWHLLSLRVYPKSINFWGSEYSYLIQKEKVKKSSV